MKIKEFMALPKGSVVEFARHLSDHHKRGNLDSGLHVGEFYILLEKRSPASRMAAPINNPTIPCRNPVHHYEVECPFAAAVIKALNAKK